MRWLVRDDVSDGSYMFLDITEPICVENCAVWRGKQELEDCDFMSRESLSGMTIGWASVK